MQPKLPTTNLVLFPLCDARGWVTSLLCNRASAAGHEGYRPDTLFFAWLTDLPESIKPSEAAHSVLTVAGLTDCTPSPVDTTRNRLHVMLAEIAN